MTSPQQGPAGLPSPQAGAASKGAGGFFGRLQRAFDPGNLAMSQALLNGDYGAAASMAH